MQSISTVCDEAVSVVEQKNKEMHFYTFLTNRLEHLTWLSPGDVPRQLNAIIFYRDRIVLS